MHLIVWGELTSLNHWRNTDGSASSRTRTIGVQTESNIVKTTNLYNATCCLSTKSCSSSQPPALAGCTGPLPPKSFQNASWLFQFSSAKRCGSNDNQTRFQILASAFWWTPNVNIVEIVQNEHIAQI
uniref:Uncharacterized protein n=1 Tax=Romanomermis culicivorax TaxID=13658 RepID=A0A915JMH8_ROMCU